MSSVCRKLGAGIQPRTRATRGSALPVAWRLGGAVSAVVALGAVVLVVF